MQVIRDAPAGKTTTQGFEINQKKIPSSQLAGFILKSREKLRNAYASSLLPTDTHLLYQI